MKDLKLSFPYPSTSRHNLSQDIALSLSMGLVIPVRTVEVLPGDSHRIATSFSLISNPLVKPLLQGVRMRYCRFWVPRRIYHLDQRANNSGFDPNESTVRTLSLGYSRFPISGEPGSYVYHSSFQQSSLFDYLGYADLFSNFIIGVTGGNFPQESLTNDASSYNLFNAEPYVAYLDICRNFFADSSTNYVAFTTRVRRNSATAPADEGVRVAVTNLSFLDSYIDSVQNSTVSLIKPFDWTSSDYETGPASPSRIPFLLADGDPSFAYWLVPPVSSIFSADDFGYSHLGFCVPLNRPDRLSRWFDLRPLTSQNATVSSSEVSISNLSFLAKLQRYLTRKFFGGSRYTDIMYSVFGQHVPHVDSPVLLDVFDTEIGSELVASTNASESQSPGVLGGYFCSSGVLSSGSGSSRRRYTFNENGYLIDVVYILPRLFRSSFVSDFLPVEQGDSQSAPLQQGNFIPDFNGIGWQQPVFTDSLRMLTYSTENSVPKSVISANPFAFSSEPSWQQYRTLPDICRAGMNPLRSQVFGGLNAPVVSDVSLNSPLFVFSDRPNGAPFLEDSSPALVTTRVLAQFVYSDPNALNRVFGVNQLTYDNIFTVFRYSHQVKRQVTKRFTLSFI